MRFSAQIIAHKVAGFSFTMILTLHTLHPKRENTTSKLGILQILPSWYILSLKLFCDCKNLILLVEFRVV